MYYPKTTERERREREGEVVNCLKNFKILLFLISSSRARNASTLAPGRALGWLGGGGEHVRLGLGRKSVVRVRLARAKCWLEIR